MTYMRDWVCKIKHAFLLTLQKNWVAIITFVFSILGIVYSISEFATDILNLTKTYEWVRGYLKIIIPIAILISFAKYWEKLQYSRFINGTDIKITLCVGNIIHQKNALVIPTNTTFDTIQDDEFISKTSVQGQFQEKYYRNNIRKLDNEICEGLKDQRPVTDTRRTHSKSNQYAIGTTCKITTHDQRHAYFLAIADINEKGKPINTKIENITDSLVSFWNFLNEEGQIIWNQPPQHRLSLKLDNKPCQKCRIAPLCGGGCTSFIINRKKEGEEYCLYNYDNDIIDKLILDRFETYCK